ncbi:MAG: GIY-YIG nuclease family protein [Desulfobacterales bacterium]|nr:GIY-YIG nuclease family protein [Desulfobacterales bacterium]
MQKEFYVYILASKRNGTLYTGVTSNLLQRIYQHKHGTNSGFSAKYNVNILVYFEIHAEAESAITREKQIKKWNRKWKIELIEKNNPTWEDLYDKICH